MVISNLDSEIEKKVEKLPQNVLLNALKKKYFAFYNYNCLRVGGGFNIYFPYNNIPGGHYLPLPIIWF